MSTDISVLSDDDNDNEYESESPSSGLERGELISQSQKNRISVSISSPSSSSNSVPSSPITSTTSESKNAKDKNRSGQDNSVIKVPRTVPCIVLSSTSQSNHHNHNLAVESNYKDSNANTIMPLNFSSDSKTSSINSNHNHNIKNNSFSINKLCTPSSDDEKKRNHEVQIKLEKHLKDNLITTQSKKLAFGIDRILSNDKSHKEDDARQIAPLPEFLIKNAQNLHNHNHNHHQHPPGLFLSQCSECFFLSRFCRRVQFPQNNQISPASFSWTPGNVTAFENSPILPTNGYLSSTPTSLSSYGSHHNFPSMSSLVSCNTSGGSRRKRSWSRAVFSNLQRKGLEKRFQIQKYITKPDRRQLAATLGLTDAQVKVWFQNRRMKWRNSKESRQKIDEPSSTSTNNLAIDNK